jgi:hypothetical protein
MSKIAHRPITQADLEPARRLLAEMTPELREVGLDWYRAAHARCQAWSAQSGYSVDECAAVLALYSINNSWAGNITLAHKALCQGQVQGLRMVRERVQHILAGEPVECNLTAGSKVRNFYKSIMLRDGCCLDRWMFRIFGKPQGEAWYPWVERCVRILALENGLRARDMQAVLWMAAIARGRGDE